MRFLTYKRAYALLLLGYKDMPIEISFLQESLCPLAAWLQGHAAQSMSEQGLGFSQAPIGCQSMSEQLQVDASPSLTEHVVQTRTRIHSDLKFDPQGRHFH